MLFKLETELPRDSNLTCSGCDGIDASDLSIASGRNVALCWKSEANSWNASPLLKDGLASMRFECIFWPVSVSCTVVCAPAPSWFELEKWPFLALSV